MIKSFFNWWLGELAALVPSANRSGTRRRLDTLVIRDEGEAFALLQRRGTVDTDLGRVPKQPHTGATPLPDLARLKQDRTQVLVEIPSRSVLRKQVQLPRAATENLREVLRFEMERLTPFRADDVIYDATVLDPHGRSELMQLTLSVLPKRVIEGIPELMQRWQFELDNDRARIESSGEHFVLAFMPPDTGSRSSAVTTAALWGVNAILLAVAVGYPLWEQSESLKTLEGQLAKAKTAAQTTVRLREELDALREEQDFLSTIKLANPPVVEVVEEVSRLLPDSTSLQRLEVRRQGLYVQGVSQSASALISTLDGSDLLRDVRFRSPVTRAPGEAGERFNIAAAIVEQLEDDTPPADNAQAGSAPASRPSATRNVQADRQ